MPYKKIIETKDSETYHKKIFGISAFILIVLLGGTIFYHYVEKWRYLDALYFSAYTITTVGYGDIIPKTDLGNIFTIFYLFIGVGIVICGLSVLAAHFIELREEFLLERFGKIKIRHHTQTIMEKLKKLI